MKKKHDNNFKARVALEAIKGEKTIAEISSEYKVHPNLVGQWKKKALEHLPEIFEKAENKKEKELEKEKDDLFNQIGRMKVENDWLKKKVKSVIRLDKSMIEPFNTEIPLFSQCELLGISRSSFYYKPDLEKPIEDEKYKRLIFEEYIKYLFYGYRKITQALKRLGHKINKKRVQRLMQEMGIIAIYPKPNLSKPAPGHKKYPYLLRGLDINQPNQVWATDITYIKLREGFLYLAAIIDLYSRKILSWSLSNTLDVDFCIDMVDNAINKYGKPEIFNSDQGSQFTSNDFIQRLEYNKIMISMDGKGRAKDNIYIERLWRSLKYEDIYINGYESVAECREGINKYFKFYNTERFHQSLDYRTPDEIYNGYFKYEGIKKAS